MSIQKVISVPVLVDEIAKYLSPKDFRSVRLVSSTWTAAFERTLFKNAPVVLDDFVIREFLLAEGGELRPRRMKNEFFKILTWMEGSRQIAAVLDVCKVFGPQIKKLEVFVDLGSDRQPRVLCKALTALKNTLEELSVRITETETARKVGYSNHHVDEFGSGECIFPVMPRLKSLSLKPLPVRSSYIDIDKTCLLPLMTTSCPNLKELHIKEFSNFQEEGFRQLREAGTCVKLESLILEKCPGSALENISRVSFTPGLKHLYLRPHKEADQSVSVLTCSINKVLKHLSQNLTSLHLQLFTLFGKKTDEHGRSVFLTLPVMPKLINLYIEAKEPYSKPKCLDLRYEESFAIGNRVFPSLTAMFPELVSLSIKNTRDVDLVSSLICSETPPHDGVKCLDIYYDFGVKQRWRNVIAKIDKALPNAVVRVNGEKIEEYSDDDEDDKKEEEDEDCDEEEEDEGEDNDEDSWEEDDGDDSTDDDDQ